MPKKNLIKFRLTLDVEFDPQGESEERLYQNLVRIVRDAVNNGTLTGETAATCEFYDYTVKEIVKETP